MTSTIARASVPSGKAPAQPTARVPTAERIVESAVELFAQRGYQGTSVGAIEAAAGLAPRSGALYKHFASKEAVLVAAFRQRAQAIDEVDRSVVVQPLGDLRAELTLLCRWALHEIGVEQRLLRILMKEGERFEWLREEFRAAIVRPGHAQTVAWLGHLAGLTGVEGLDLDALAVVTLSPIIYNQIGRTLFGEAPGRVEQERFVSAWADSTLRLLRSHGLDPYDHRKEVS